MYFCVKIVMYVYVVISVVGAHGCAGGLWGKMGIRDFSVFIFGGGVVMNLIMGGAWVRIFKGGWGRVDDFMMFIESGGGNFSSEGMLGQVIIINIVYGRGNSLH